MAADQAITAQALLLLNAAKVGPSVPLRIASLNQLAETWKQEPALLPVFLPHAYSIAAEPSSDIRCAVVDLAEKVVCGEGFGEELKGVGENYSFFVKWFCNVQGVGTSLVDLFECVQYSRKKTGERRWELFLKDCWIKIKGTFTQTWHKIGARLVE